MAIPEQRGSRRKVLKVRATLSIDAAAPEAARTHDLAASGMCLTLGHQLAVGKCGVVAFELYMDGKATPIEARVKVTYCIFSGGQFKIGCQFVNLSLPAMTAVAKFLR